MGDFDGEVQIIALSIVFAMVVSVAIVAVFLGWFALSSDYDGGGGGSLAEDDIPTGSNRFDGVYLPSASP